MVPRFEAYNFVDPVQWPLILCGLTNKRTKSFNNSKDLGSTIVLFSLHVTYTWSCWVFFCISIVGSSQKKKHFMSFFGTCRECGQCLEVGARQPISPIKLTCRSERAFTVDALIGWRVSVFCLFVIGWRTPPSSSAGHRDMDPSSFCGPILSYR